MALKRESTPPTRTRYLRAAGGHGGPGTRPWSRPLRPEFAPVDAAQRVLDGRGVRWRTTGRSAPSPRWAFGEAGGHARRLTWKRCWPASSVCPTPRRRREPEPGRSRPTLECAASSRCACSPVQLPPVEDDIAADAAHGLDLAFFVHFNDVACAARPASSCSSAVYVQHVPQQLGDSMTSPGSSDLVRETCGDSTEDPADDNYAVMRSPWIGVRVRRGRVGALAVQLPRRHPSMRLARARPRPPRCAGTYRRPWLPGAGTQARRL